MGEGGPGGGGRGKGGELEGVGPENHIKLTNMQYRIQITEHSCSKTHVRKITNALYLFFYMGLGLIVIVIFFV